MVPLSVATNMSSLDLSIALEITLSPNKGAYQVPNVDVKIGEFR